MTTPKGKKAIMVMLEEADRELVKEAAYRQRMATASWIRNIIVAEAINQTGGAK